MVSGHQMKWVYENRYMNRANGENDRRAKAFEFVTDFRRDLGIKKDSRGNFEIREAVFNPDDFNITDMVFAMLGPNAEYKLRSVLDPQGAMMEAYLNPMGPAGKVMEAGEGAVVPGHLPDVSAWLGSVSGLLDARILQGYRKPEYLAPVLAEVVPTKTRQTRLIATGRIGDQAAIRLPGAPHPRAQFEDRVVLTPETDNLALACEVTFEAVFFDQTQEVMARANSIGEEIGLREEKDFFRLFAGTTNDYLYNGTSYNTYIFSGGNWANELRGVLLEDWTDVQQVWALVSRMTDQETSNRITISLDTMVTSPLLKPRAVHIQRQTSIATRTKATGEVREGNLDSGVLWENTHTSPYLDEIHTTAAPNGEALAQAVADQRWYMLNTKPGESAFIKTENWPFTVEKAAPDSYSMKDHKLILGAFADRQAVFSVREPRRVVRCLQDANG